MNVPDTESRLFPYWRRNMTVLPAAGLIWTLGFALSWPFVPLMLRGLGVQDNLETWVGFMLLAFYIIGFVCNPIWGGIADHYGRKIMVLRATLGMGTFMALLPLAPSPYWFAGLLMLVGIFNGVNAAANTLLVASVPPRRIGMGLAMLQSGSLIGRTIAPAVGAAVAVVIGPYHWMYWISSALLLTAGALTLAFVREVRQPVQGRWRPNWVGDLRTLVAVPRLRELYFLTFLFSAMWSGSISVLGVFVLDLLETAPEGAAKGAEAFWVGAVAFGLALSTLVALPFWGWLLDRVDPARVLVFSALAAALCHVPLVFLGTTLQLVLARVAFGLTATAMEPAIIRLIKAYAPVGMDARAISYNTSFQFIAMGLAPFTAGLIGPWLGLRAYFALTVVLMAVGVAMWLRVLLRTRDGA